MLNTSTKTITLIAGLSMMIAVGCASEAESSDELRDVMATILDHNNTRQVALELDQVLASSDSYDQHMSVAQIMSIDGVESTLTQHGLWPKGANPTTQKFGCLEDEFDCCKEFLEDADFFCAVIGIGTEISCNAICVTYAIGECISPESADVNLCDMLD